IVFGFLTPPTKDDADPLVSARSVSAWLRHLPTQDVIARQHQVMRIFDGMRQSARPTDLHRVAAIQFLDTALGADRARVELVKVGPFGGDPPPVPPRGVDPRQMDQPSPALRARGRRPRRCRGTEWLRRDEDRSVGPTGACRRRYALLG